MSIFESLMPMVEKTLFKAALSRKECQEASSNRTYHITLDLPKGVTFNTGDSIAIYPENKKDQVLALLEALNLDPEYKLSHHVTAFDFVKKRVSLNKWSSKLSSLLFQESKLPEELKDLEPIDILKTLTISSEIAIKILELLPPQLPRYYSIASAPCHNQLKLDLLVSLSSYEKDGVIYFGVASNFLCLEANIGDEFICFIHPADHFRIPEADTPIVMIGPGTGVAPFRAFIQSRIHLGFHKNWLFFGERNQASDFYYENEFSDYVDSGKLKLSLAFSRDQEHKIYVQDRLLEQKEELISWIKQGAIFYVCGDAKQMAKSVEAALIEIISEAENLDFKSAQLLLRSWRKDRRYNLDVY